MRTRVVIVDDHRSVRQLLATVLSREPAYEVAGEAGSGLEALQVCLRHHPDVVILDLMLPELCGSEVLRRLRTLMPRARILVYSGTSDPTQIVQALRHRPHGFVGKRETLATFLEALRVVASGGTYLTGDASGLLQHARTNTTIPLSSREQEVLQLIAESRSSKQIASRLGVAVKTVDNHRTHLMEKLQLHDIAALTRFAIRSGMVSLE